MTSTNTKPTTQKTNVYQLVTDRIMEALEQGIIPWRKTWVGGAKHAVNWVSKRAYTGINALLTNLTPYEHPYFITFKQANALGGRVRKGAKSIPVVFWKKVLKDAEGNVIDESEAGNRQDLKERYILRYYRVFNIADIEELEFKLPAVPAQMTKTVDACEQLVANMPNPPAIEMGDHEPCYVPAQDSIYMPSRGRFGEAEMYYSVLFHELIHATGHESRLNREAVTTANKFGSLTYSQEELTAEIGAAYLCKMTGIELPETFENSVAYLQSWLEQLRKDKRFVFRAASEAKTATQYILGK